MAFTPKYSSRWTTYRLFIGRSILRYFVFSIPFAVHALGQQSGNQKSNIEVIHDLVQQIGRSIVSDSRMSAGDSLSVAIADGEGRMMVQGVLLETFRQSGQTVFLQSDTLPPKHFLVTVAAIHVNVRYDDMFRDGFLGSKKARRAISGRVECQVVRTGTNEVTYSNSPSGEFVDTIFVDDISKLERGASPSVRGELPSEEFFDRAVEPLIIIGATGVAVFLFFHVRS